MCIDNTTSVIIDEMEYHYLSDEDEDVIETIIPEYVPLPTKCSLKVKNNKPILHGMS